MAATGFGTYMRVRYNYEEKIRGVQGRLLMDVHNEAAKVAKLEGEIKGYQDVIKTLSSRSRRKSLGFCTITAYDLQGCLPYTDGVTSIGLTVGEGIAAVDPKRIPYGKILYIPKLQAYYVTADTGIDMRRSRGIHIDIFKHDRSEALEFGRKRLEVILIDLEGS